MIHRLRFAAALLLTFVPLVAGASALTETERLMVSAISSQSAEHEALLEEVVNINSGTMNAPGVRAVGTVFAQQFEALGLTTEWLDLPAEVDRAGHLVARTANRQGPNLLLIGHLDTVFEPHSDFQRFERLADGRARGPGVTDMKGGNVVIVSAIAGLRAAGVLDQVNLTVILTGDEERAGKPIAVSRAALLAAGHEADFILGFENNIDLQSATVARRGSSSWLLRVSGTRGHSSQIFSEHLGAGAIFETARILDGFYSHVRGEANLTFNPGLILGGTEVTDDDRNSRGSAYGKKNVVAQSTVVHGGLRFITEEQKEHARNRMRAIVAANLPQTTASIEFTDSYPAMPPARGNMALYERLNGVSQDLGHGALTLVDPGRRGAADISFVGRLAPALAGLGPVGDSLHAEGETVELASIPLVAARAAVLMWRLSNHD